MANTKTVGLLAYGSLVTDPGREIKEVTTRIIEKALTPFPVEFARSSRRRGGAPTLVPYDAGGHVRASIFVLDTPPEDAVDRLYRREINAVGTKRRYERSNAPGPNTIVIDRLEQSFELDIVFYTRIAATIDQVNPERLAELAIASVRKTDEGRDGITYLMKAMACGIETPLTSAYEAEIKQRMVARDLSEALAKARAG